MFKNCRYLILILLLAFVYTTFPQAKIDMKAHIPPDPSIRIGKLDNGLTYYIKVNKKPEKRAELIIAVKAGSVQEDDDQKGLAHFCEHMAFNGTKTFPKNDLVNYLESIGVRFGNDLNAFTSYDRTVYMLTLPTDNQEQFAKGMQVIEDWSHNVTYDNTEIDKERGVILEEWRLRKGASDRVFKKHNPVIFYNSRFALRDVIGDTNIITKAPYEALKRFYHDWYRPELMAVIAVGDFDPDAMEKDIKARFSSLKDPQNARPKVEYDMPMHKETFVSIATDKELPMSMITLYFKRPGKTNDTYGDSRANLVSNLFSSMLGSRLDEIRRKPDSPYLFAFANDGSFMGNASAFSLMSRCKNDKINDALKVLFEEAFRVMKTGFTQSELDRAKKEILRGYENSFNEANKTESRAFAMEYSRNFIDHESIPGIAKELELCKEWLPGISLAEVNALSGKYIKKESTVIAISAPDKPDVKVPTEQQVLKQWDDAFNEKLVAYKDDFVDKPLLTKELKPGTIVAESSNPDLGITEIKLSNGIKVILKPTDFKNDEISFSAYRPGGTSLLPDNDFYAANSATNFMDDCGWGSFTANQLQKKLADKLANVSTRITGLYETVNGNSSKKDLETMFQLIYLKFTEPRKENDCFDSYISKLKAQITGAHSDPKSTFFDTVAVTLSNYHFRTKPLTEDIVGEYNLNKAFEFYKSRFSNAADFKFFFVGSFKVDEIKPFILKYIATLPAVENNVNWKDVGQRYPAGEISKEVRKGIEKQSTVQLVWTGDFDWNRENRYNLRSAVEVLNIKLREILREEKGGVYGVRVMPQMKHYPHSDYALVVYFGCNPDRVDELIKAVKDQMKDMVENAPAETYMTKVKEIQLREREVNLKENRYWLNALQSYYQNGEDPSLLLQDDKLINNLKADDVLKTAQKYFTSKNFVKLVLNPEK